MTTRDSKQSRVSSIDSVNRRRFLQTTGALGITSLAGCGGILGGGDSEGVEYWTLFGGGDGAVMEEMVDQINESDEHDLTIDRQRVPFDEYYDRLYTSLTGDQKPDLAVMHADEILEYEDLVVPYTDHITTDPYTDDVVEHGVRDGELLAVPLDTHPLGLYYNEEILEEAGVDLDDPPNTPERFREVAEAITENTDHWAFQYHSHGASADYLNMGMAARGGQLLTDDFQPAYDNDDGHAVMQTIHDWVHEHGWAPDDSDTGWDAWNRGELGMIIEGTWHIGVVRDLNFDWDMTEPFFFEGDSPVTFGNSHMLIVPEDENRTDEEEEDAFEAARLLTQDYNDMWGYDAGHLPASQEALESDELRNSETWDQTLGTFYQMVEDGQHIAPRATPNNAAFSEEIYQRMNDMRSGNMDPQTVVEESAEAIRDLFDDV